MKKQQQKQKKNKPQLFIAIRIYRLFYICECRASFLGDFCELPVTTAALENTILPKTVSGTVMAAPTPTEANPAKEATKITLPSPVDVCYDNYHGSKCENHCKPTDDCSRHYVCDKTTGHKLCRPGWTPESNNCTRRYVTDNMLFILQLIRLGFRFSQYYINKN